MYVERVRNQFGGQAILLRESFREDGKVKKRTILNLSKWDPQVVDGLQALLKGGSVGGPLEDAFEVVRTLPHGHVAAVQGTLRKLGIHRILSSKRSRERDLVEAMIVARILDPRSKLATANGLGDPEATNTIGDCLGLGSVSEMDLYAALDWLEDRQQRIEGTLAKRHLEEGSVVLYDLSSSYVEGNCCPYAKLGYSRDKKKGKRQINFGLLCDIEGRPLSIEVFDGNTGDPSTLKPQVEKLRERFGFQRIILVGDRGMITEARIREDLQGVEGLDWITCLRAAKIRTLFEIGGIQMTLLDETNLAEIEVPEHPNERFILCRNPALATERARKRSELLAATEEELAKVVRATERKKKPLQGKDQIGLRVGKLLGRYKVGKHFQIEISEHSLSYQRDEEKIAAEAALDGLYVVRTSVAAETMDANEVVGTYKSLARVERAFRRTKTVDLKVRPIFHYSPERVRAHFFLCMLAYYVEWHMRQLLAPLLFDDEERLPPGRTGGHSAVEKAIVSSGAERKARTKRTEDGFPVHSFQGLLGNLAIVAKNWVQPKLEGAEPFEKVTVATPLQRRAFELLGVKP